MKDNKKDQLDQMDLEIIDVDGDVTKEAEVINESIVSFLFKFYSYLILVSGVRCHEGNEPAAGREGQVVSGRLETDDWKGWDGREALSPLSEVCGT